jgi:hypothetical protein
MTARHRPQPPKPIDPVAVQTKAEATAHKRRHIFRWVFLAIQALFLVWIIAGAASSSSASCARAERLGVAHLPGRGARRHRRRRRPHHLPLGRC